MQVYFSSVFISFSILAYWSLVAEPQVCFRAFKPTNSFNRHYGYCGYPIGGVQREMGVLVRAMYSCCRRPQANGWGSIYSCQSCEKIRGWPSAWSQWSTCSNSCGWGVQTRKRQCTTHVCRGMKGRYGFESRRCVWSPCCPVDGKWTNWSPSSGCSVSCGQGFEYRVRSCTNPAPKCGGEQCKGVQRQYKECVGGSCAEWGSWAEQGPCSATCGEGVIWRLRECFRPGEKGLCPGDSQDYINCNNQPCPVEKSWCSWGDWGECSTSCRGTMEGIRKRTRVCECGPNNLPLLPATMDLNATQPCDGAREEVSSCSSQNFCSVDGGWSNWGEWSQCSARRCTINKGIRIRFRTCDNPFPQHGGLRCLGRDVENESCLNMEGCPIEGTYQEWGEWSECDKTCGRCGKRMRIRQCLSPFLEPNSWKVDTILGSPDLLCNAVSEREILSCSLPNCKRLEIECNNDDSKNESPPFSSPHPSPQPPPNPTDHQIFNSEFHNPATNVPKQEQIPTERRIYDATKITAILEKSVKSDSASNYQSDVTVASKMTSRVNDKIGMENVIPPLNFQEPDSIIPSPVQTTHSGPVLSRSAKSRSNGTQTVMAVSSIPSISTDADALLQTNDKSQSANNRSQEVFGTVSRSTNAQMQQSFSPSLSMQSTKTSLHSNVVKLPFSDAPSYTTEAPLQSIGERLQSTQARIQFIDATSQSTQAQLQSSTDTPFQSTDARLQSTQARLQSSTDAPFQSINAPLQSTQARLQSSTDAPFQSTDVPLYSTDRSLYSTDADALLQSTNEAPLQFTSAPMQSTKARLQSTNVPLHSNDAPLYSTVAPLHSTDALLQSTNAPLKSSSTSLHTTASLTRSAADFLTMTTTSLAGMQSINSSSAVSQSPASHSLADLFVSKSTLTGDIAVSDSSKMLMMSSQQSLNGNDSKNRPAGLGNIMNHPTMTTLTSQLKEVSDKLVITTDKPIANNESEKNIFSAAEHYVSKAKLRSNSSSEEASPVPVASHLATPVTEHTQTVSNNAFEGSFHDVASKSKMNGIEHADVLTSTEDSSLQSTNRDVVYVTYLSFSTFEIPVSELVFDSTLSSKYNNINGKNSHNSDSVRLKHGSLFSSSSVKLLTKSDKYITHYTNLLSPEILLNLLQSVNLSSGNMTLCDQDDLKSYQNDFKENIKDKIKPFSNTSIENKTGSNDMQSQNKPQTQLDEISQEMKSSEKSRSFLDKNYDVTYELLSDHVVSVYPNNGSDEANPLINEQLLPVHENKIHREITEKPETQDLVTTSPFTKSYTSKSDYLSNHLQSDDDESEIEQDSGIQDNDKVKETSYYSYHDENIAQVGSEEGLQGIHNLNDPSISHDPSNSPTSHGPGFDNEYNYGYHDYSGSHGVTRNEHYTDGNYYGSPSDLLRSNDRSVNGHYYDNSGAQHIPVYDEYEDNVKTNDDVDDANNCMELPRSKMTPELEKCCKILEKNISTEDVDVNAYEKCFSIQLTTLYNVDEDFDVEHIKVRGGEGQCRCAGKKKLLNSLCCLRSFCHQWPNVLLQSLCRSCKPFCPPCYRSLLSG